MNDRQRYAVGIAAAVLIHLFAAVMLGLFGVKYMEVPFRGEVLQVSIDTGGNRGGGGGKGKKAPAVKSMMLLNLWKCLMKKLMKRQRKKSRSRRTGRIRKKQRTRQVCLLLMPRQEMKG